MAVEFRIDKEHLKRGSLYRIDPRLVKVNPELNARHELPPIDDLLHGFLDHGQLQPCPIGNDGGDPVLRMGHRRWRTAIELTKTHPLAGLGYWPLVCVYYEGTEWDAYLAAIGENHHREGTTPIDDAHNCARMKRHGMEEEAIAVVYYPAAKNDPEKLKTATTWVKSRLALVTLAPEGEKAVKEGRLKPTAAVAIAKLSQKAQKELFAAQKDAKRITGAVVKGDTPPRKKSLESAMADAWSAYADDGKDSMMSRLGKIQMGFLKDRDVDAYHKAILGLLRSTAKAT